MSITPVINSSGCYSSIPAFLKKLRSLVDNEETNHLIAWDETGESFHIFDGNRLAKEVLPMFFKHNNLSSFIRQLNMYGFRKVNHIENGSVYGLSQEDMEFSHVNFIQDNEDLMIYITRKPTIAHNQNSSTNSRQLDIYSSGGLDTRSGDEVSPGTDKRVVSTSEWQQLLSMVHHLKSRQGVTEHRMKALKEENEHVYRELANLKMKHARQTRVIDSMMTFFRSYISDPKNLVRSKNLLALTNYSDHDETEEPSTSYAITSLAKHPDASRPPPSKLARIEDANRSKVIYSIDNMKIPSTSTTLISSISSPSNKPLPYTVEYPPSGDSPPSYGTAIDSPLPIFNVSPNYKETNSQESHNILLDSPPTIAVKTIPNHKVQRYQRSDYGEVHGLQKQKSVIAEDVDNMQSELNGFRQVLTGDQFNIEKSTISQIFDSPKSDSSAKNSELPFGIDDFFWDTSTDVDSSNRILGYQKSDNSNMKCNELMCTDFSSRVLLPEDCPVTSASMDNPRYLPSCPPVTVSSDPVPPSPFMGMVVSSNAYSPDMGKLGLEEESGLQTPILPELSNDFLDTFLADEPTGNRSQTMMDNISPVTKVSTAKTSNYENIFCKTDKLDSNRQRYILKRKS